MADSGLSIATAYFFVGVYRFTNSPTVEAPASHGAQRQTEAQRRIDPHLRSTAANMPIADPTSITRPGGRDE
jgi:hypothetical protein